MTDEGFGDAIVYTKVGKKKFDAVESSMLSDFRRLLNEDFDWIGYGDHSLRFLRQSDILDHRSRIKARLRKSGDHIRAKCQSYFETVSTTTFTYDVTDLAKKYNGGGQ